MPIEEAVGHIASYNVVDANGRRLLRKGTRVTQAHLEWLRKIGQCAIDVAVLAADDLDEEVAALQLAKALQTPALEMHPGVGGRVNLYAAALGVVYVADERLFALNELPGVTLATVAQHAVVQTIKQQVATVKILPFAIAQSVIKEAVMLIGQSPPLIDLRPVKLKAVSLLIVGQPAAHAKLRAQFERAVMQRLELLGSTLHQVETVAHDEATVANAASALLAQGDMLIVAGQTSINDADALVLNGLRQAGAYIEHFGAPVDPGNLLALAYVGSKPILCAPGCIRSPAKNVVDLVLPRLLVGERLTRRDIARLGLGGVLG
ncbi:MAG: hypothetical protein R3A44_27170 [Caldilineaceae bacterium]